MDKYLNYSTMLAIFSEALFLRVGFDLKLFYLIMVINLIVILMMKGFFIKTGHLLILIYAFASGGIAFILGHNKVSVYLFQIIGITITSIYFYLYLRKNSNQIREIFERYCQCSFWISSIGIVIFIFTIASGNFSYRLKSVLLEPAHFCGITLPAFYFYLKSINQNKLKFIIVALALILSFSSVGYLGIMVSLILTKRKFNFIKLSLVTTVTLFLGFLAYSSLDFVALRINDTFKAITTFEVENVNLSSYALISNLFVALMVFKESPIFGNGLGSHETSHARFIEILPGSDSFGDFVTLNAADANSLFIRVLSDFGLVGILGVLFFIVKYNSNKEDSYIISRSILIYFFYKLLREGHYFSPEMYFFVFFYYFLYRSKLNLAVNENDFH